MRRPERCHRATPNAEGLTAQSGFTLIELSIVLVIIGLIVGGVLVGRDLINAAAIRAQITQIEKFKTAINTFSGKFGALPGDIDVANASQFGLPNAACSGAAGERNGNGIIESANLVSIKFGSYENSLLWSDLSSAAAGNLVEGNYTGPNCNAPAAIPSTALDQYLPRAKIGNTNWVYAYAGTNRKNYLAISRFQSVTNIGENWDGTNDGEALTVIQAYTIDSKIDDANPIYGNVTAQAVRQGSVTTAHHAASSTATTCFVDTTNQYSIDYSGNGVNCTLGFRIN